MRFTSSVARGSHSEVESEDKCRTQYDPRQQGGKRQARGRAPVAAGGLSERPRPATDRVLLLAAAVPAVRLPGCPHGEALWGQEQARRDPGHPGDPNDGGKCGGVV